MLGSMAPAATGSIVKHLRKDGLTSYWLRVRAYGERHRIVLGNDEDGWTRKRAEAELRNVLARIDAGIWRPPEKRSEPDVSPLAPRFHAFASEWFDARLPELAPKTQIDYRWRLSNHLLPFFHAKRVDEIDAHLVDQFRSFKLKEADDLRQALKAGAELRDEGGRLLRPLGASSVNKLLALLAAILESAVDYGYLDRNPGRGRQRRVKEQSRPASFLEADELVCVLDAAAALDERARSLSSPRRDQIEVLLAEGLSLTAIARRLGLSPQTVAYHAGRIRRRDPLRRRGAAIDRHAIMTTLGCAGLRAHELCDLNVEDVDLIHDRLNIRDAKTAAGVRYVYMTPKLKGVLGRYLSQRGGAHGAPLFPTETGRRRTPDSLRKRVFEPIVDHARQLRAERGHPVLPRTITPHTMRRTFISLWLEADPPAPIPWLMAQVGHAKPDTLLRIYAQVMQRDRAKIGSAFDALMAGAALPAETAIGPMIGPMGPNTASAASDDAAETQ